MNDVEFIANVKKHRNEFYRYVNRNVWNSSVAEDVFSTAIIAAFKQLSKFKNGTNFRAWIFRILTNKCFVANRETKRLAIDIDSIDESVFAIDQKANQQANENPEWFLEQCGDETFRIQGPSGAKITCDFCFWAEFAAFENESGIVALDEIPFSPGSAGFRNAALTAPTSTILFRGLRADARTTSHYRGGQSVVPIWQHVVS